MNYFTDIRSFAQLKKEYRRLALENHPDRGGDTRKMQDIIAEFDKLFKIWENRASEEKDQTGYADDYAGSSSSQYREHVYREYRWTGRNYKGQQPEEVVELIRVWLKETYPRCKFSVTRKHYDSIYINLMSADFTAFREGSEYVSGKQLNHYNIEKETELTDRAMEVMRNVIDYASSYNFDDSDAMTDYFHSNFFLNVSIGRHDKPFKTVTPQLKSRKGDEPKQFKHTEGPAHKAIRQALGKCRFAEWESRRHGKILVLGTDYYGDKGETHFYPMSYSSAPQGQKRLDKLIAAGIDCKLLGYNGGYIQFLGYNPITEQKLEKERQEYLDSYKKWIEQNAPKDAIQQSLM